jgi:hypothetical protein
MNARATDELVRIAAAGGGFRINAARCVDDLVRIAAAAGNSKHGTRTVIHGVGNMSTDDLVALRPPEKVRLRSSDTERRLSNAGRWSGDMSGSSPVLLKRLPPHTAR